jgi:hypothetical protein
MYGSGRGIDPEQREHRRREVGLAGRQASRACQA